MPTDRQGKSGGKLSDKQQRQVVVTGMGVVSPIGSGVERFWAALCAGTTGIRPISRFDTTGFPHTRGGEVPGFHTEDGDADIGTRFMLAAAAEALSCAGLTATERLLPEAGVVVATNFGGIQAGEPLLAGTGTVPLVDAFQEYGFQACADRVAELASCAGPRIALSLSCASGAAAIGLGMQLIRSGRASLVLAGGYDGLSRFAWSGLSALRTMTKDEIRPFDLNRAGTIFSEGAGALVLEDEAHARDRGAPLLARALGYGLNNNAHHLTAPAREGAGSAAVMQMAIDDAGIGSGDIGHVNTHGTGTKHNDVTETQAIKTVFGEAAAGIPITSVKSATGHMMGAAGTVEAIASILSIRDGVIPPTMNGSEPDPDCDLDCVRETCRHVALATVLSNSAGIGGCNGAVVFSAPAN